MNPLEELEGLTPAEAAAWIRQRIDVLTPDQIRDIELWVEEQSVTTDGPDPEWMDVANEIRQPEADRKELAEARDAAMSEATAEARRRLNAGDIDLADIGDMAPAGLSDQERDDFAREAHAAAREQIVDERRKQLQAEGVDEATAGQLAEDEAGTMVPGLNTSDTPTWFLEQYNTVLTDDQKARILEYWNDMYGTRFQNWTDIAGRLEEPTQLTMTLVESAMLDVEPSAAWTIDLGGSRSYTLKQDELEAAKQLFGLSNDGLTRLIRLQNSLQYQDDPDDARWQITAGLLAARNQLEQLTTDEQLFQDIEDLKAQKREGEQPGELGSIVDDLMADFTEAGGTGPVSPAQEAFDLMNDPTVGAVAYEHYTPSNRSVQQLSKMFDEGFEQYHNSTLAFVHALDQGLAYRISASGGDPTKLDPGDNAEAIRLLTKGGVLNRGSSPLESMGAIFANDSVLGLFQDYFNASGANNTEQEKVRRVLDEVGAGEAIRALWRQMFRTDPSDEMVQAFTGELQRQLDAAPEGQEFDVSARIRSFATGSDTHKDLYGAKPGGVSEEEYQAQFLAGAQSLLGNEVAPNEAILQGMKSGKYQTTVGAIAGAKSSLGNSRFMERLARAANVISENT